MQRGFNSTSPRSRRSSTTLAVMLAAATRGSRCLGATPTAWLCAYHDPLFCPRQHVFFSLHLLTAASRSVRWMGVSLVTLLRALTL